MVQKKKDPRRLISSSPTDCPDDLYTPICQNQVASFMHCRIPVSNTSCSCISKDCMRTDVSKLVSLQHLGLLKPLYMKEHIHRFLYEYAWSEVRLLMFTIQDNASRYACTHLGKDPQRCINNHSLYTFICIWNTRRACFMLTCTDWHAIPKGMTSCR